MINKIRGQIIKDPKERIKSLSKIDNETGCWNFKKSFKGKDKLKQYGHLIIGSRTNKTRKTISAHRYSYEIFNGEIKDNLWVLHKCDNPRCVNPNHLFLGTIMDNVIDRDNKNRNKIPRLIHENHPNCKINWLIVNEIREKYKNGISVSLISKEYIGITTKRNISDIVNFKTWIPKPPKETE